MERKSLEALQNLFLSQKELIYVASCPESTRTDNQVNSFETLQNFFLSEEEVMSIKKFWQTQRSYSRAISG